MEPLPCIYTCKRDDCVIQNLGSSVTLMGWTQTYDKYGNPLGKVPNTRKTAYKCLTCNKMWDVTLRNGEATVNEITGV